jgi:hypothetical protein
MLAARLGSMLVRCSSWLQSSSVKKRRIEASFEVLFTRYSGITPIDTSSFALFPGSGHGSPDHIIERVLSFGYATQAVGKPCGMKRFYRWERISGIALDDENFDLRGTGRIVRA